MRLLVILSVVLVSCGKSTGVDVGEQTLQIEARGLWLTSNPLGAPAGALSTADNAVIRRPGVVEPRRGQKPDTNLSSAISEMTAFEGNVVAHLANGSLIQRTGVGTSSAFTGTYTAPTGHPVRFTEAGGGLYFTTNAGPYRLDSLSTNPVPAGTPPGLEGSGTTTGSSGWLYGGVLASGTVTLAGGAGNVTIVINGTSVGPVPFNTSDNQTATDCATAINASGVASIVTASALGAVITITADASGPAGNYSLTASRTAGSATASGATLTGGVAGDTVGYRFVWGSRDGDGALLLGAPSGRVLVANTSGGTRDVLLTTPIPDGVVYGTHFLQVYRTVLTVTSGDDPGEDMALVAEEFPIQSDLSAGTFSVTDIASFANGATAYFSPSVGQGTLDAKEQPPLLTDGISFKGYVFGVVQAYRQSLLLTLLGASGGDGLGTNQGIVVTDGTTTEIYFCNSVPGDEGTSPSPGYRIFYRPPSGTAAVRIEDTARSLVRVINGYSSLLTASYVSTAQNLPGQIALISSAVGGAVIEVLGYQNVSAWAPSMRMEWFGVPTRVGTTVTVTGSDHFLRVGQQIELIGGSVNFPAGVKTVVSTPSSFEFTYTEAGAAVTGSNFEWRTTTDRVTMEQSATPGSWATSAFEEPDAWPPRFRYQVGGPNTVLYRITSQGEALLFWTSDGLYRLTGTNENDFTLRPLDPTIQLVGFDTPATMGNKAMALTSQGVVSVTDLGVEKVSTPIDLALLPYYASTTTFREVTDDSAFGIAYQSENEYMLFLPTDNGPSPGDLPVQAYVFNVQTGTWVRHTWEWSGINAGTQEVTAAVVNPADNYLYIGAGTGANTWIARERKDRALSDYQDADNVGIPLDVAYQVNTAKNPGALKQWSEVACLLEAPQPTAVELYFTTELDSAEEGGTISSQANAAVRTYIPRNKSRSARLTVGLRHSTSQQKPTILGLSVVYNTTSTRVGR